MKTNTTSLLDIAYKEVEDKLSKPTNINKYKQFMSKFVQKNQKELYANIPRKMIYYSNTDVENWFNATGISKAKIKEAIKGTYYSSIGNFNPRYAKDESTMALLCMVRYFFLNEKKYKKEYEISLINLSFSGKMYTSIFYGSFQYEPADYVMDYVVNYMLNNKYDIVKYGNVIGAVRSIANTWMDSYKDRFKSFTDEDCVYLIQQLHNRIGSFMHNIAELYYEAYENKDNYITYDSDDLSEDNFRLVDNDSFKISTIVTNTINEITNKNVDYVNCKRASNDTVKFDELKNIIDSVTTNEANIPILKEFISIMVSLYFAQSKGKDILDISFISFSIKPTPNSKDKNVLRKKELMDIILINNSENFQRRRNRKATESAYYRSFNAYMALMIQKANKNK